MNGCANVRVIEAAVSDRVGEGKLRADDNASAHLGADGDLLVRTLTLDDVVFGQGLRPLLLDPQFAEGFTGLRLKPGVKGVRDECRRLSLPPFRSIQTKSSQGFRSFAFQSSSPLSKRL